MKYLLLVFCLLLSLISLGQDTLYERDAAMYSIEYVLNPNGTFTYSYWHCTGNEKGMGKYEKNALGIKFKFEEMPQMKDRVVIATDTTLKETRIKIFNVNGADTTEGAFYSVTFKNVEANTVGGGIADGKGEFVFKGEMYDVASIICGPAINIQVISINALGTNRGNSYVFYVGNFGKTFVEQGKVHTFKKAGKKYYKYRPRYRVNRWDEDVIRGRVKVWYVFKNKPANQ